MADPLADLGITAEQFPSERFGDTSNDIDALIEQAAYIHGVDSDLVRSVVNRESGGNPEATSYLGAAGMMQLMPATAEALGVTDPYDPEQNIMAGTRLLRQNMDRFGGREDLALAAYHGGPSVVRSDGTINPGSNDGLTYTTDYVRQILAKRDRLKGIAASAPSLDELGIQEIEFPDQPAIAQPPMDDVQVPLRRGYQPEAEPIGVSPELVEDVGAVVPEPPGPTAQPPAQPPARQAEPITPGAADALKRGLGVAPPPEYRTAEPQVYEDFSKMRELSRRPEEAVAQAAPEEIQAGLQAGPVQRAPEPKRDVIPAADVVRSTPDPAAKAAFMANLGEQEKNALLAEMPEGVRTKVEQAAAQINQEQGGPAFGFAAIKSTPLWALVPEESKQYAESAMRSNPSAAMVGQIAGTVTQTVGLGGAIGSAGKFQKAMQAAKGIESNRARVAAVKGLQALQRGIAGGSISGVQQLQALNEGKITLKEAIRNAGTAALANVASVLPEGVSNFLPTGTKMAGEILAQVGADAMTTYLLDKATGREYRDEEMVDVLGVKIPKEYILNAAMAAPFAVMDVRSQGAEFDFAPRSEVDAGRVESVAPEIAGTAERGEIVLSPEGGIRQADAIDRIAKELDLPAQGEVLEGLRTVSENARAKGSDVDLDNLEATIRQATPGLSDQQYKSLRNTMGSHPLTQLPSKPHRNSFTKALEAIPQEGMEDVWVSADYNFFKRINDLISHNVADDYMIHGQRLLHRAIAEYGGRHFHEGGDEASAVFRVPKENVPGLMDAIARIKRTMNDIQVVAPNGERVPLGISVGVGRTFDAAENALNVGKQQIGRNSIFVDNELKSQYNIEDIKGDDYGPLYEQHGFYETRKGERRTVPRPDDDGGADLGAGEGRDVAREGQRPATSGPARPVEPGARQEPRPPTTPEQELAARVQAEQPAQVEERRVTTPRPGIEETREIRPSGDRPEDFPQPAKSGKLEEDEGAIALSAPRPEGAPAEPAQPGKPKPIGGVPRNQFARFVQQEFASRGLLPEKAFEAKLRRDFKVSKAVKQVEMAVADFETGVRQAFGPKPTDKQIYQVDAALKGEALITDLPAELRPVVKDMRAQIDALTQRFIDEGLVEGDLAGVFADNMGFYAMRTYRVNDVPNWAKQVWKDHPGVVRNAQALIRDDMRDFHTGKALDAQTRIDELLGQRGPIAQQLRDPILSETDRTALQNQLDIIDARLDRLENVRRGHMMRSEPSDDEINRRINELLYRENAPMGILANKGKLGAKNLDMLKRRKDIPPQIRALWGEYKNADVNYAKSVSQMAQTLANHEFLKEVAEMGRGEFLWREGDADVPPEAFVRISAEDNPAYKPLDGMYTTPEIAKAFQDATGRKEMDDLYRLWLRGVGGVKYAKTVLSWMTHARNLTGNVGFAIANGHFNVSKVPEALNGVFKDFINDQPIEIGGVTLTKSSDKIRRRILHLTELGVISQGVRAGEIKGIIQDATAGNIDVLIGTGPRKRLRKAGGLVTKAYGAEDDVWKWYAFENELARYRKALPDVPIEELEQRVARIVIDTYPTYAMTPAMIQRLRRFPVLGTFVSFPAEVIRTGAKRAILTKQELSDPRLRAIGAQRLVGQMLAYTIPAGLSGASMAALGVTRKKEDAMRKFLPPWSENSVIVHLPSGSDQKPRYIDLSYTDPNSYFGNAAIALLRGDDERALKERVVAAATEMLDPYLSEDLAAQKVFDIMRNKTKDGRAIWNPVDDPEKIMLDVLTHAADAITPGTLTGIQRMYKATVGAEGKSGTPYDFRTEAIAQGTGVRVTKADIPRSLGFQTRRFRDNLRSARELEYTRGEELSKAKELRAYGDFYDTIKAAYVMGMSKPEVIATLKKWGLSQPQAAALASGYYENYVESLQIKRKLRK